MKQITEPRKGSVIFSLRPFFVLYSKPMNIFEALYPDEANNSAEPPPAPKKKEIAIHVSRQQVKKLFDEIRNRSQCSDCGWNKIPALLEFHHTVRGTKRIKAKRRELSQSPRMVSSIGKMEAELKKGIFLCPTCHKMRHYNPDTGKVESSNKDLA